MKLALVVAAVAAVAALRPACGAQLPGSGAPEPLPASLQAAFSEQASSDFRFAREDAQVVEAGEAEQEEPEPEAEAPEEAPEAPTGATGATGATGDAGEVTDEPAAVDPAELLGAALLSDLEAQLKDEEMKGEVISTVGSGENAALDARLIHTSTGAAGAMKTVLGKIDALEKSIDDATAHQMERDRLAAEAAKKREAMQADLAAAAAEISGEASGADTLASVNELARDAEGAVDMYQQLKDLRQLSAEYIARARDASAAALDAAKSGAPVEAIEAHLEAMRNMTVAAKKTKEAFFDLKKHIAGASSHLVEGMEKEGIAPASPNPDAEPEDEGMDPMARKVKDVAVEAEALAQQAQHSTEFAKQLEEDAKAAAEGE